jgi:hypothetical protein
MAKTIPQLTEATTVDAGDELIVQQGGITKRAAASLLINNAPVLAESSTTSRSLEARFAEMTNVKDFGAVGDGTADDTAAINAAVASRTNGGTIYFPQGRYRITSTVTVTSKTIWFIGEGADPGYTQGSGIVVDTGSADGLLFQDASNCGIARMTVQGPSGTARLTGGSLIRVGAGIHGFTLEDSVVTRGYNAITVFGSNQAFPNRNGFQLKLRGCRIVTHSGDYVIGSITLPGETTGFQQITAENFSVSAGDHLQYVRFSSSRTFTFSAFTADLADIQVTSIAASTFASTRLVKDVDYTITQNDRSVSIVIDAGVSLTSGQYLEFRKLGGLRGIGTTLVYLDGRTGSHKFVNFTGGFAGDGFWITNTTQEGRPNFYYIANGGWENITGTAVRLDTAQDVKIANCYFAAEERGIDIRQDAGQLQNINNVFESGGRARLTVNNHGFDGTQDVIVSGILGTDIKHLNGRYPRPGVDEDTGQSVGAGYTVVDANTLELLETALGSAGLFRSPVFWLQNPEDSPAWTPSTGNARTREVGSQGVNVVNAYVRAAGKSGIRVDSNAVQLSNCRVTQSGAADRELRAFDVVTLTNSGGAIQVTTKYPHWFETGDLVRFSRLKKSAATVLSYVYASATVVNSTTLLVSLTGMNSTGATVSTAWDGPYDTINDSNPVFVVGSGANVELTSNADDVIVSNSLLGDQDRKRDITPYGIWNKSGNNVQIVNNNTAGVRRRGIRNDVASPSVGFSQIWRGNITDTNGGLNAYSELIGLGTPESVVTAPVGSLFQDQATGEMYRKNSGAGNTGWLKFTSA